MSDVPSQGSQAQVAVDDATPFDASSIPIEIVSESLQMIQTHVGPDGIRGTRSRIAEGRRIASEFITGSLNLVPGLTEIDWFIEKILGGTTAAGVTAVAETIPAFQVMIDRVAKLFTYTDCRVSRAIFAGSEGSNITLSLELEGETEVVAAAGGFPSLTLDTDNHFILSDCTLTLQSSARKFASFELVIDNLIAADRQLNSVTREELSAQDRAVSLTVSAPYTVNNVDLYDQAIAGAAGILAISDGTTTYTFDFGNVKVPAESPVVSGKTEIMLPLTMDCFKSGANAEILCTKT